MTLTTEMIRAGQDAAPQLSAVEIAAVWRAMCAAAPVAVQAQPTIKESLTVEQPVSGADGLPFAYMHVSMNKLTYPERLTQIQIASGQWFPLYRAAQPKPSGADGLPVNDAPAAWMVYASDTHQLKRIVTSDPGDVGAFGCLKLPLYTQPQPSGNAGQLDAGAWLAAGHPYWQGFKPSADAEPVDLFTREQLKAALAAQAETPVDDKAHPRFLAGYAAGLKDHLLNAKTDEQLGGLLASIRNYGSFKYAEAKGRTEPDLSDVRAAWGEVYEKAQALAARAAAKEQ